MNEFTKTCPKCGSEQTYSYKRSFLVAIKKNSLCWNCSSKKSSKVIDRSLWKTEQFKNNAKIKAKNQWKENRDKMLMILKSLSYRKKCSLTHKKMWKNKDYNERMRKIHKSDEYRKKLRERTLNFVRSKINGKLMSYSKTACDFIDGLNIKNGWNLKHALNNNFEEHQVAGYLLDGYDKHKNIVFEYDEPYHYDVFGNLKKKDVYRQNIILKEIQPFEFWRYDEQRKKLYNVISKKELT
jgi:hypothetical protein